MEGWLWRATEEVSDRGFLGEVWEQWDVGVECPVGECRMFVMQRGTSEGSEFLVLVGWGCRGVTCD